MHLAILKNQSVRLANFITISEEQWENNKILFQMSEDIGKHQESIKSSTTPGSGVDTILESDKNTRKHHTQESQQVRPFPAGDSKAQRSRHDSRTKTNMTHKSQKGSTNGESLWNCQ